MRDSEVAVRPITFEGSESWYAGFCASMLARYAAPLTFFAPTGWAQQGGARTPGVEVRVLDDYRERVVHLRVAATDVPALERFVASLGGMQRIEVRPDASGAHGPGHGVAVSVHGASWSDVLDAPESPLARVVSRLPLHPATRGPRNGASAVPARDLRATRNDIAAIKRAGGLSWRFPSRVFRDRLVANLDGLVLELWSRLAPSSPWLLRVTAAAAQGLPPMIVSNGWWHLDDAYGPASAVAACSGLASQLAAGGLPTLERLLLDLEHERPSGT